MIRRVSEYVIRCDNPTCDDPESIAPCVHTRADAETWAIKNGWKPTTYKRWLCPACVKLAEKAAKRRGKTEKFMDDIDGGALCAAFGG